MVVMRPQECLGGNPCATHRPPRIGRVECVALAFPYPCDAGHRQNCTAARECPLDGSTS